MTLKLTVAAAAVCCSASGAMAAFATGDLAVFQAAAAASNTTAQILEVGPTAAGQAGIAYAIPDAATAVNGLRFSGSASSTGYLSRSADRTQLLFDGANNPNATANLNTLNPRGVGSLNNAGAYSLATTYTGTSGNQTRSATTLNGSSYFISDQGGIYTNGSTAASPAANTRGIKAFGGVVYALQASALAGTAVVNIVSAPSGGTVTGLPGLGNDAAATDFYLIASGDTGATFDVLYTVGDTSATAGAITKYSLVGGSWTSNGAYTTAFGGFGLAAADDGNGADLFVTTGTGATTANSLLRLVDTAGFNAPISIVTANDVSLLTGATGTILKGVEFAPIAAVPEPASLAILAIAGVGLVRRRKH